MQLSEALARTSINRLTEFSCLADVLELDIVLPKEVDYVARSAITQACKNSVAMLFVMFFIKLPQRGMSEQSTRIGVV